MKLLYCVDMQNDFVTGVLGSEYAQKIVPNVVKKVREHLESGNPVIFTRDTHIEETYSNTREGKHLPILHCVHETEGWQLIPELQELYEEFKNKTVEIEVNGEPFPAKICVIGDKLNRFGLPMFEVSEQQSVEETKMFPTCEFIGVATNMCVISAAITMQTFKTDTEITIDASCCASFDPILHEKALDIMESIHMNVINRE